MKRWIVVLLVSLAVVIIVSPGIVGRLAEQSVKGSIDWAQSESEDFTVTEESFERGWFTAEGRHRIELKEGDLRARIVSLTGQGTQDAVPALIVDTRIDHGLVPVTSLSRESGSLVPGLASTVSTMQLDLGNGELITVPGTLYSQVRLSGTTVTRYLVESGSFAGDGTEVEWDGADIGVTANPSRRSVAYDGAIKPLSMKSRDATLQLGLTTFEGDSRPADYGLMVGSIALAIDSLAVTPSDGDPLTTGNISFDGSSDVVDERVNGTSTMAITGIAVPGFGDVDLALDVTATGLDARSFQSIVRELRIAQRQDDPDAAVAALYPRLEGDIQALLSSGAELQIDRFDVTLPQGEVTTRFRFTVPQADANTEFSWPALLLALTASADLTMPVALMELAQAASPQAGVLVAMGILKQDGDSYILEAEYQKGLLTVNGAPMPIPLPGR